MFGKDFFAGLFDDTPWTDEEPSLMEGDVLSDVLPWRIYDDETKFYRGTNGTGFILEVGATIGDHEVAENIAGVMAANLPSDAMFQILNWTSPSIDTISERWKAARGGISPLVDEMVQQRLGHMNGIRYGMDEGGARALPLHRHIFLACWMEGEIGLEDEKRLNSVRTGLNGVFSTVSWSRDVEPRQFLAFLREVFHVARPPKSTGDWEEEAYEVRMPLNFQLPGATVHVGKDALMFSGEPEMAATVSTVNAYPPEWEFARGMLLNGDPPRLMDRPLGPVLTSFTMKSQSNQKSGAFLLKKRGMAEHAANSKFGELPA